VPFVVVSSLSFFVLASFFAIKSLLLELGTTFDCPVFSSLLLLDSFSLLSLFSAFSLFSISKDSIFSSLLATWLSVRVPLLVPALPVPFSTKAGVSALSLNSKIKCNRFFFCQI
jgi:hypothetical protein